MSMGPMQPKPEGATTVFVLGLLGLLLCGILGIIIAWVQGNDYLRRCQAMGVEPEGLGVAGRIMGIIATVILIIQVCVMVVMLLGMLAALTSSSHPVGPGLLVF